MQFRPPTVVIDEAIDDLTYLVRFLLDDIEHGITGCNQFSPQAVKAIAALDAVRVLVPRLRIVRSNYVADSRLAHDSGAQLLAIPEGSSDVSQAPTVTRNPGVTR